MALTDNILAYWKLDSDGSGLSLVDSTGNSNVLINENGVALGSPFIGTGSAEFNGNGSQDLAVATAISFTGGAGSVSFWAKLNNFDGLQVLYTDFISRDYQCFISGGGILASLGGILTTSSWNDDVWHHVCFTCDGANTNLYIDGANRSTGSGAIAHDFRLMLGNQLDGPYPLNGNLDEMGIWDRALTFQEVTELYNSGLGNTYPFAQTPASTLYYNNAENDGDWGNLLNWWQDSGFTNQATALPTSTNPINLYAEVTQNTEGANQCFCSSASFWSANFGAGLTLQASGVVNMQGASLLAGTTTDGVSMHDSSQLTATSVVDGNVTMRDSSRAFGSILGNATIYYDGGNGQYPIGGTVTGSVTYLGWPAVTPQWFNDQATGGGNNGDFSDSRNWWTSNTYTIRPVNAEGTQELPDASTDVFIAPNTGIVANSGTANPTIKSVTANNSNIQNISITATNGFLFSGNEGVANAVLYGNVVFQDTAYNDHAVIQGKATYKSAASLQFSWGENSLGNVNAGMYNGSTAFEVNISSGGGGGGGTISRLLNLPWFINI